jgi:hypothetical protein
MTRAGAKPLNRKTKHGLQGPNIGNQSRLPPRITMIPAANDPQAIQIIPAIQKMNTPFHIKNRTRIPDRGIPLLPVNPFEFSPGFAVVGAALQNQINLAFIPRTVPPRFTDRQHVCIRRPHQCGNPIGVIPLRTGLKKSLMKNFHEMISQLILFFIEESISLSQPQTAPEGLWIFTWRETRIPNLEKQSLNPLNQTRNEI